MLSGSRGPGTAVARGEGGTPRSVVGPDECHFPQPTLTSPFLRTFPPARAARLRGELRVGKCSLPDRRPALATETRCLYLAAVPRQAKPGWGCSWLFAPGGQLGRDPGHAGGSRGCGGEPRDLGKLVPSFPTLIQHARGRPGISTGLSFMKRPFILSISFISFFLFVNGVCDASLL